jgi:hypothetical protein
MDKTIIAALEERTKSQNNKEKQLKKEKLAKALRDNLRRRKTVVSPISKAGYKDLSE